MTRTRTVVWEDPMVGAKAAREMRGIDYLQAIARGEYPPPPIAVLMGFSLVEVAEGRAAFAVEPGEHHYNPIGLVHGGLLATILDSAMGCAVHSSLPAGTGYTTLELHVNLVRAVSRDTGRLVCEAELLHRGGRVATAQGRVRDAEGRMYAHGTTTCLLVQDSRS
jgi:uncharacterized protein (TIGR00369 family)